jgi:hypothetical protein
MVEALTGAPLPKLDCPQSVLLVTQPQAERGEHLRLAPLVHGRIFSRK